MSMMAISFNRQYVFYLDVKRCRNPDYADRQPCNNGRKIMFGDSNENYEKFSIEQIHIRIGEMAQNLGVTVKFDSNIR